MNNQIFYGEQQTEEWHQLRLGLFTSSTIYHLFEDSSKQAKATALMKQLKDGLWQPNGLVLNHRPTAKDTKYICKYLVDYKFLKAADIRFIKADLKELIKSGSPKLNYTKEAILLLTACYALQHIEVASGSMKMLCKKKAEEIIWELPTDPDLTGVKAVEWGKENEGFARQKFEEETLELLDKKEKKISFIRNENLQTGSSPDDTIEGCIPVEYKNPEAFGVHYDHWQIKNGDQLLQFDKQKYYQIQHQIWMLNAKFGYFVSFDQRLLNTSKFAHKALFVLKIERNEKVMKMFEPKLLQAIECRNKFIENF